MADQEATVAYEAHEPGCGCEQCGEASIEQRLASLERKLAEHVCASEPSSANEYVATNSRGDVVFGPTDDYKLAKMHADRAGGVVRFWFVAREVSAASDFNSRSAAIAAARSQGWTHVRVIDSNREELFRPSKGYDGWDKTDMWYEKGRWHIGGPSSVTKVDFLPYDASPRADLHRPAVREHVSYADRKKLKSSAFALPARRALLLTDKHGNVDAEHVRAAAARLSMMRNLGHVTRSEYAQAHRRIQQAGRKVGVDVSDPGPCPDWYADSEPALAVVERRRPDRRNGQLPWVVTVGRQQVVQADTRDAAVRRAKRALADEVREGKIEREVKLLRERDSEAEAAEVAIVERTADARPGGTRISSPKDLHRVLGKRYGRMGSEVVEVVLVNLNDEMIGSPVQVAMGQVSGVRVEVEQIMAAVIAGRAQGATAFYVTHPHPAGTLHASPQDRDLTRRIEAARKIACPNVEFRGHYVITEKGWAKA
jgi:hypothetical protein